MTHRDLTDEEWDLIADPFPVGTGNGLVGRPLKHDRRSIVNAILYVAATGCQWRALPECHPHWNTVHRYHLRWSRDGTWERTVDRLRQLVRDQEGHDPEPSAGIIDAQSARGAAMVGGSTRGYDAGKKISGRKCFGVVDTLGLCGRSGNVALCDQQKSRWSGLVAPFAGVGLLSCCSRLWWSVSSIWN